MPPIRGSSSEDTLLSELGAKITAAFRRARPDHYNGETHPGDWLHHIESLCSSCGITRGAWSRLAVIQLRGAARHWWESSGQDLNLIHWSDFRRNIMEYFVGPFLYRERRAELTYTQGRRFFTRAAAWAPIHVPHEIRALVYFPRPYPDYDHLCSEVIYAEMHLKAERVNTPPTREFENVEDVSSHVEASAPHQPGAVGDDDAHIDSEEEDPTEVFSEGEDDETDGP
ncbi:hypothetical protein TIFTF001_020539 [Ficus carica]|uniref:Retrotransposon gag domain-containing protein n=1 Tax=Ficus carica TaxID=3494 RepID=A0AA88AAY5_FICCA|nr:hypothetical protein TIFTF001_020539 [Ficus carica]